MLLIVGYVLYGGLVERIFAPDAKRQTPAIAKADGVDFMVLPNWPPFGLCIGKRNNYNK